MSFERLDSFDLVGVGIGPANLSLAVALAERSSDGFTPEPLFLDQKPEWSWHPGMLLPESDVQVPFLKDLVSLHDPTSRFSFLNYLKENGRILQFLNLRNFFPGRVEFNDYYAWVADQLDTLRWGYRVESLAPRVGDDGRVSEIVVRVRDVGSGDCSELLARNLVIATGGTPKVPEGVRLEGHRRVTHSGDFLRWLEREFPDPAGEHRFLVVGSGQSSAEIFRHLLTRYSEARVEATLRRFAYKPLDDSSFVNELFFPEAVDFLYSLEQDQRADLLDRHRDTDRSAVDAPLIREIYELLYRQETAGKPRGRVRHLLELESLEEGADEVVASFRHLTSGRRVEVAADGVVLATGYERNDHVELLAGLEPYLERDGENGYRVSRDYRVSAREGFAPRIYLQGFCEETHGSSDPLLSLLPLRSQRILESLAAPRGASEARVSQRVS